MLAQLSGVPLTHVPYRGASNQLTDTAGGSIDMTFVSLGGARPFIKDSRVRAIAITSPTRSSLAPELPAVAETKGLEKYSLENWFGLFAPAATPPAVVQKLNAAVTQALKDPELAKRLQEVGGEPAPMASAQFRGFIQAESARFAKLVVDAKITPSQLDTVTWGRPSSAIVGTSGRLGSRLSLVTASARVFPAWIDGSAA